MPIQRPGGYSAIVESWLITNGGMLLHVAKTNGTHITLVEAIGCPPCKAELVITIDGKTESKEIEFPNGIRAGVGEYRVLNR